jgi:hypothetical protein
MFYLLSSLFFFTKQMDNFEPPDGHHGEDIPAVGDILFENITRDSLHLDSQLLDDLFTGTYSKKR